MAFVPTRVGQVRPRWQLDPDLILHLPFWNMPDGQVYLSQDAYGHSCTRNGATPTSQAGWSFDGTNDYGSVPHNLSLSPTKITVGVWFKPATTYSGVGLIALVDKSPVGTDDYGLNLDNDGGLGEFFAGIGGVLKKAQTTTNTWNGGQWYCNIGTFDGIDLKVYVNSILEGTTNAPGSITAGTNALRIGTVAGADGRWFNGFVGKVIVYNRALKAQEIFEYWQATRGLFGGG